MGSVKIPKFIYYTFVGLFAYFVSEKFLGKKRKSELDEKDVRDVTDVRGGDNSSVPNGFLRLLLKDASLRIALLSVFVAAIKTEVNAETLSVLSKIFAKAQTTIPKLLHDSSPGVFVYTPVANESRKAMKAARKVIRLSNIGRLQKILQTTDVESLREILIDESLTGMEKAKFLLIKSKALLKNLNGRKRELFIMALLSLIYFLLSNETIGFTAFLSTLRELFKSTGLDEELGSDYIIELYSNTTISEGFNLPEEVINQIMK